MVAMAFTENDQPRHEDSTTTTSAALSYVKGLPMSHARSCTVFRQSRALLIAAIALGAGAAGARAADISTSFTDPGSHTFTVPPGATWVDITAVGAAGGPCGQAHGGSGASVEATVPVVPGEVLSVGVGSPGPAGCGQSNGAGGAGGGANGGKGGANGGNGGGGGGASSVTVDQSASEIHNQPLVIAAGGGGASLTRSGGDAEAAGEAGGQPGSVTAGGTGGGGNVAGQEFIIGQSGSPGSLGAGGAGGDGYADPGAPGGGGGGGGYYGGGGGGGGAATPSGGGIVVSGGGGGGGSNYVTPARTDVGTSVAAFLSPRVTVVYPTPSPTQSVTSLSFPAQTQGTSSGEEVLTLSNNGTPLIVSGISLAGPAQGDYLIDNRCSEQVDAGHSCQIGVRFVPQQLGARSATLTVRSNAPTGLQAVSLLGTGVPPSTGPGAAPSQGAGSAPSEGTTPTDPGAPAGQSTTPRPSGTQGANGRIELITCVTVSRKVIAVGTASGSHSRCAQANRSRAMGLCGSRAPRCRRPSRVTAGSTERAPAWQAPAGPRGS